ncbi:MAG: hypothetical protein A2504_02690 [Bdellovibrionales bacterium RIFOXYD12_FULL_39_22]|nr:MAG: hypothetical protein A2385_12720 [Bdellovibrionales bacterium RIFOXYB1_FULL_39_21]OFZ41212.1 MAG: hypothetical protein A2485_01130 [Bdellovibrionales bacterium RIFOXYC12_FULL_39_17]OFZ44966.1 MAG: hypothetical protein A2404_11875 [Bdellovibrionales bacterium RIFOXYC1_FULL_39_130]OFZ74413.1 MAG: hypothetical protein A2560_12245 [Bdellovibrionales bacterium RIFOXYD1_FULL_39_84]OFZ77564.1 MAG: hypothetical protein A2451_11710 [Bdellovibrionales bacterium RIFOXYC2_FULL_39_8]OFZ92415.1 MAG:
MPIFIAIFFFFSIYIGMVVPQKFGQLLPENSLKIPPYSFLANDITREEFAEILKRASEVYAPVVKKKLGVLHIQNGWAFDEVNAYAQRVGPLYSVTIYGGLARHPLVTRDGVLLAVCHELGHHLGGAPKTRGIIFKWPSSEGASDYFASLKCFRNIVRNDDNIGIISAMEIDHGVTERCALTYKHDDEKAICVRAAMAGKSLADLFALEIDGGMEISFDTPSREVVEENEDKHTDAQCRLDTYWQGALCNRPITEELSDRNSVDGACHKRRGDQIGLRPACWFADSK